MLNVIKYKIYELFHMVSFYVIMLVMTVWVLLTSVDYVDEDGVENLFNYAKCFVLDSGFLSMFFVIFLAIYFTAEYKNGFIKSIATNCSKLQLIVGNFIATAIVFVVYTVYMLSVSVIVGCFVVSDRYFGSVTGLLKSVGLASVVYLALAAIILAVSMLARGTAWPIIIGLMICTQFTYIITTAVKTLFDLDISKYQISYYLANLTDDTTATIVAGSIYFVIFGILSLFIVKKKDV